MFKKVIFSTLFAIVFTTGLQAQKTAAVADPVSYYNRGLQLFDKEQYASAMGQFNEFIGLSKDAELLTNARYYVALSSLLLEHEGAEERMEKFIDEHPGHIKTQMAHFQLARHYYNNGNWNRVPTQLKNTSDEALTFDESLEYHFMLGYSYFKRAKWEDAYPEFVITSNDKTKYYYPSHYYLGYIALKQGEYDKALKHFDNVKTSKVYGPEIPLYIAQIHFGQGKYQQVLDMTDTMRNNPNKREINWMRGQCYYYLGKYKEAMPLLENNQPPHGKIGPEERYVLGYTYYSNAQYQKAYEELTQINRSKDTITQYAYYTAAECFLHLERKSNARDAFYQASLLDYNARIKEQSTFNYAKLSFDLGFNSEALTYFSKFIKDFPKSDMVNEAKTLQGEVLLVNKDYEEAIKVLESITKMSEETKRVYQQITFYYGVQLLDQGWDKVDEADKMMDKSKKNPYDKKLAALADFWKGEIAFHKKKYWDCIKYTREFLNYSGASGTDVFASAWYNTGYSYIKIANDDNSEGDVMLHYGKAAENFQRFAREVPYAKQSSKQYLDGIARLGDCYFVTKKYDKALEAYSTVITKNAPASDYAYFQQGIIYGLIGNDDVKVTTLKKIPALFPRSSYIDDALYEIAMVHMNQGKYNDAEKEFGYLLGESPRGAYAAKCHLKLGIMFFQQNRNDRAKKEFENVIENFGNTAEAKEAASALLEIYKANGNPEDWEAYMKKHGVTVEGGVVANSTFDAAMDKYREENCAEAVKIFAKYIKSYSTAANIVDAHYYKANCEYKLQNLDEALKSYLYVIDNPRAEFMEIATRYAATIYYLKKDYAEALPLYEKLETFAQEGDNRLVSLLGQMRCSYYTDNQDKTVANSKKLLAYDKVTREGIIEANLYLARIYVKREDWGEVEKASNEILKLTNNQYGAEAKYYIALVQYKKGRIPDSEKTILEVLKKFSGYDYWRAKALLLQSDILIERKDYFQARGALNSIINSYETQDDGILEEARTKLEGIPSE